MKTCISERQNALRLVVMMIVMAFAFTVSAQKIQTVHKVKKQETIFGIAKTYGITMDELSEANPFIKEKDFVLKKGMHLNIPEHKEVQKVQPKPVDPLTQKATIGVMLPLHDINGDGKRMVEYYRGMLMAISDMKREGYSVTVNAWNVAEGDDVRTVLLDEKAAKCDVIFGPLYTTQVRALSEFCVRNKIKLVIPFSINGNDVKTCPQIWQVYQTSADISQASIRQFVAMFKDSHPVFIDCNDPNSKKGEFTFPLRKQLEEQGIEYSITNLNNSLPLFMKAFRQDKRNVVVLNTGRSPELGVAFQRLDQLTEQMPGLKISMFGYNEWFLYTRIYNEKFHRYDTYIPSTYNYKAQSADVQRLEKLYQQQFGTAMQAALPRFALTGYDQTQFFLRGFRKYGKNFTGTDDQRSTYTAVQTPYLFEHYENGGYQNRTFMLVHF